MFLNKEKRNWLAAWIAIIPVLAGGCYYDKEELLYPGSSQSTPCATVPATFKADVLPLITANCAIRGCHDATASGGQIFQSYNQINGAKGLINIQALVQKSMPPAGPLSPAQINTISCWIQNGAPDN